MTWDELRDTVAQNKEIGLSRLILVVSRKSPPSSDYIRVKGFGKGYVMNAIEKEDGGFQIVAQFEITTVEKTLAKYDAQQRLK